MLWLAMVLINYFPIIIELIHGPRGQVCVKPVNTIGQALILAASSDIILTSFGDMLRVPGTNKDLQTIKAQGGNVKIVYSTLDALNIALNNRINKLSSSESALKRLRRQTQW